MDDDVVKAKECVKYYKGSQVRKQRFLESVKVCDFIYSKRLRQNVPTRWNSTYLMFDSAIYYKRVFNHLEAINGNFTHYPRFNKWVNIEKLCGLRVLYEVTCAFSRSKYTTFNLYSSNVVRNRLVLNDELGCDDAFMKNITTRMFAKFEKY